MFITFEGLDYSGKTTQAALLVRRLQQLGREVLLLREPGGTEISEKIRTVLLDNRNREMSLKAELFLFSAARTQLVSQVIRPALQRGTIVICDRFHDSTTAYQGYGRGLNLDDVHRINAIATDGTIPDVTLFIDIVPDEIFRRRSLAGQSADRMESSGRQFYERARQGFLSLAQMESGRFVVINGMESVEIIHGQIWNAIQQRLH
ncbi:MAG: dTMP kinase [Bacteroidota bacterium]